MNLGGLQEGRCLQGVPGSKGALYSWLDVACTSSCIKMDAMQGPAWYPLAGVGGGWGRAPESTSMHDQSKGVRQGGGIPPPPTHTRQARPDAGLLDRRDRRVYVCGGAHQNIKTYIITYGTASRSPG